MLVKLPNGDWVNHRDVRFVCVVPNEDEGGHTLTILLSCGNVEAPFPSREAAEEARDTFAGLCNDAERRAADSLVAAAEGLLRQSEASISDARRGQLFSPL